MRYLVRYTGPEWRAHAHNRRNATRACSQDAETHHGIPLHSNGVCSIETCGTSKLLAEQPTSRPSKPIMLSVTRVVSGVCPPTNARKHAACLLWPRPNASLDSFALKTCSQHTAPPRARASLGRASNRSPIKMHHIERCTGLEWRAHAHARRNAPHACFGHAKSVPRALWPLQSYGARNGTSHSARTRV